jgi:hypothetical protein
VIVTNDDQTEGLSGFRRIVLRIPLYFGLAIAAFVAIAVLVVVLAHFGIDEINQGWSGFVFFTGFLFWIHVRYSRALWHRRKFWLLTLAVLIIHCAVFGAILRVYPEWRAIWFLPIVSVEAGMIDVLFVLLVREKHPRPHQAEQP